MTGYTNRNSRGQRIKHILILIIYRALFSSAKLLITFVLFTCRLNNNVIHEIFGALGCEVITTDFHLFNNREKDMQCNNNL